MFKNYTVFPYYVQTVIYDFLIQTVTSLVFNNNI